jgi:hypothetical protein
MEFERIRRAFYEADRLQDVGPLADVLDPQAAWAANSSGPWNCHSRDEVLQVWRTGLAQGMVGHIQELEEVRGRILLILRRQHPGRRGRRLGTHILSVHNGLVTQIQDYRNRKEALLALEPRPADDS